MNPIELNVLVAEDNPINIFLMKKLLAQWQVKVDYAHDGLKALEFFKSNSYDLILMDLQMPQLDGFETVRTIREIEDPTNRVHIIALSASLIGETDDRLNESGFNDFLTKPFDIEELKLKLLAINTKKFKLNS